MVVLILEVIYFKIKEFTEGSTVMNNKVNVPTSVQSRK